VFETFRNVFQLDELEDLAVVQATPKSGNPEVDQLLKQFGGGPSTEACIASFRRAQ
jgi:hypothetical protein